MRDKVFAVILAGAGAVGTVWSLLNFTPWVPWAVAFIFCALIMVDGIARMIEAFRPEDEQFPVPDFLKRKED